MHLSQKKILTISQKTDILFKERGLTMKSLNFEQIMVINLMGLMGGSVVFGLYLMNLIVTIIK
jgi:hypothetical protein